MAKAITFQRYATLALEATPVTTIVSKSKRKFKRSWHEMLDWQHSPQTPQGNPWDVASLATQIWKKFTWKKFTYFSNSQQQETLALKWKKKPNHCAKAAWSELSAFQAMPFPVGLTKADNPSAWPSLHKHSLRTAVWKFKLYISYQLVQEQPQQEKFTVSTEASLRWARGRSLFQGRRESQRWSHQSHSPSKHTNTSSGEAKRSKLAVLQKGEDF